nr:aminotransferase class I/II-fold pyridoxal phosphate-dependent enzyme [Cupriavidus sp. USMAA2-4]
MTATDNFHRNFLAHRVLGAKPSATKEMTRLSAQLKREGHDVITLSQGEPDFPTPEHIREAAKAAIDRNESRYTDVAGTLALREAVVRKFQLDNGLTFSPQQIQVGCGAKQQSTSHTSSISQAASIAALDGPMDFLPGFVETFRQRRDSIVARLRAIDGITCDVPPGAFYAFPGCHDLLGRRDAANRFLPTAIWRCSF